MNTLSKNINQAIDDFDDIQMAIIEKGINVPFGTHTSEYGKLIRTIETDVSTFTTENVNFYDYDGTILHSFTVAEAAALTDLPSSPTHDGLIFQGWNWTLEDIKSHGRGINVGAMYTTASGKSEFDLTLTIVSDLSVTFRIYNVTAGNPITVDWGDGMSENATTTTAGAKTFTHTYASIGQYTATVDSNGEYYPYGTSSSPYNMFNKTPSYICTAIRLGNRCTSIGTYAFQNCYSLTNIIIPNSVTNIRNSAFVSCYSLTSATIPNNVTSIGTTVFSTCYSLKNITIPHKITIIDSSTFQNCYSLTNITIPDGVTSIGSNAFQNCYSLTNITIPDGVTSIGSNAFAGCYSLTNITIPDGVTSIGTYAFQNCYSLTNITIPDGVTKIDTSMLQDCRNLISVTIPNSVTSIGLNAFQNCYSIIKYTMLPTEPPTLSSINAFTGINGICIIEVPKGTLETYRNATNWTTYANYMREAT